MKKIGGQLGPLPSSCLKVTESNFVIAVLSSKVELPNNYVFEDALISHCQEGQQVMNFAHCLNIVFVIGKYTDVFRGIFFWWGDQATWEDLSVGEIFHGGREFPTRGRWISQHYLKHNQILNKKQIFITESKD